MTARRQCEGTTKKGDACKAQPLRDSEFCIAHSDRATQAETGFGGAENGAKGGEAGRVPKLTEVLRDCIEERADEIIGKLLDGLEAERAVVVGTGPNARLEVVHDQELVLKTVREIFDRIDGRPRQVQEITGADGDPLALSVDRASVEEMRATFAAVYGDDPPCDPEEAAG